MKFEDLTARYLSDVLGGFLHAETRRKVGEA